MKYCYEYTIRYQDVDDTKHLRWVALEEYLLEVAGTVADDLGFGIAVLHPRDLTWILTHLSVQMSYMPMPQDKVGFETWIEQNAHMLSTRASDRRVQECLGSAGYGETRDCKYLQRPDV